MTQTQNSDHRLKNAIDDELGWTPSVNGDRIGIAVADGAVTLSGQVANYPEKQAAISAALRVRGVTAVVDEIVVQHTSGTRDDADIARDAGQVLEDTAFVPAGSVHATLCRDVLTLTGTVGWDYQRSAAQRAVAAVPGVTTIVNHIVLDPPVSIAAADAKANILSALVRNARLDAEHVEVSIEGTRIRLTGKVSSWAERHQAEHAGWSTPGVTHVDNQLQIVSSSS